jgi:hypothetical protein
LYPEVALLLALILEELRLFQSMCLTPLFFLQRDINTEDQSPNRTAIFKVTGGTYFWQFSFFDGAEEGVYFKSDSVETLAPKFSHHKLTCFEFADGVNSLSTLITQGNVPNADYSAVKYLRKDRS